MGLPNFDFRFVELFHELYALEDFIASIESQLPDLIKREEEKAFAQDDHLWLQFVGQIKGFFQVYSVTILGHGEIHDILGILADRTRAVVADMASAWSGVDHDHIPRANVAAENCIVCDCAADGSHVHMLATKQGLEVLLDPSFNLVDDLRALIIALSWMPLRISVNEIRTHNSPCSVA